MLLSSLCCFCVSPLIISFYDLKLSVFCNLQEECKRVSSEGQNLRLDLSNKFQDAIKVWNFFCSKKIYILKGWHVFVDVSFTFKLPVLICSKPYPMHHIILCNLWTPMKKIWVNFVCFKDFPRKTHSKRLKRPCLLSIIIRQFPLTFCSWLVKRC